MLSCGSGRTVCVDDDGNVWNFGIDSIRTYAPRKRTNAVPKKHSKLQNISVISCGFEFFTACIDIKGILWTFGTNAQGQLGLEGIGEQEIPTAVPFRQKIIFVDCGISHTVCIDKNFTCWAFGNNRDGQLGVGLNSFEVFTPQLLPNLTDIRFLACGGHFTLFGDREGNVYGAGDNQYGQLGLGNTKNQNIPVLISDLAPIDSFAAGHTFSLFLINHQVFSCGNNTNGELGQGNRENLNSARKIDSLPPISSVSGGTNHSMFIDTELNLWVSGYNCYGQLGLGHRDSQLSPVKVSGLTGVANVGACLHTVVQMNSGELFSFGSNLNGELGLGNCLDVNSPTEIKGYSHILGLTTKNSKAKSARK